MNTLYPINDFLYLLQLEEYNSQLYLKLLPKFLFRRNIQQRDTLKNTKRIKITRLIVFADSIVLLALVGWGILQLSSLPLQLILSTVLPLVLTFLVPYQIYLTNLALNPIFESIKLRKELQAQNLIKNKSDLIIIAITGSFGKTTTKNILSQLLNAHYKMQGTPGNINTSIGIAQWLLKEFKPTTELLIVEMDAYYLGEIKRACKITPPNISVITNFGDQHLEKLGGFEHLVRANLEVIEYAKNSAKLIITKDEYNKAQQLLRVEELLKDKQVIFANNQGQSQYKDQPITTNLTEGSSIYNANLALKVVELLDLPAEIVKHTMQNIELPDRRGNTKEIYGFRVIDKSYNISESNARSSVIEGFQQAKAQGKNLLIITAGIPDRGQESTRVNTEYGQFLKDYAKYIILLQSDYAPALQAGLGENYPYVIAKKMSEAIENLSTISSPDKTLVLMQPELTDLSY